MKPPPGVTVVPDLGTDGPAVTAVVPVFTAVVPVLDAVVPALAPDDPVTQLVAAATNVAMAAARTGRPGHSPPRGSASGGSGRRQGTGWRGSSCR